MDTLHTLAQVLGTGLFSALLVAAAAWLLRSSLAAALSRSVNRDLERLRADLNGQLELVRYELNREAHKADLIANKRYDIYPQTLEKMKDAHRLLTKHVDQETSAFRGQDLKEPARQAVTELRDLLELKSLHFESEVRNAASNAVRKLDGVIKSLEDRRFSALGILGGSDDTPYSPPRRALADANAEINRVEALMRNKIEAAPPKPAL
jgi:hypothetical protein